MLLRRHSLFLSTGQTHAFLFVFFIKKSKLKCTHKLQFNFSLSAKLDFRESISLAPFFCLVCVCVRVPLLFFLLLLDSISFVVQAYCSHFDHNEACSEHQQHEQRETKS